jgi:hypothetical protein
VTAAFLVGGPSFGGGSDGFLFFVFVSSINDFHVSRQSRGRDGILN